jgi:phospholipase/carboxylesterase
VGPRVTARPHQEGRVLARPHRPAGSPHYDHGVQPLNLAAHRDGLLFVPATFDASRPVPLVLALHGAGGDAEQMIGFLTAAAERREFLVLSPDSRGPTWDLMLGSYGPDAAFIDDALNMVFDRFDIDPTRIAVSGFSDGGSYALSIGITNGSLFSDVLAFSPGFMAPSGQDDRPRIFISHGSRDTVLPVERCGRRLAQVLEKAGYDTVYHEFDGGHVVPDAIVDQAVARFLAGPAGPTARGVD